MTTFKENLINKIKSSPRFGDLFVNKNLQEILKERRFLFFTKKGPIEVVFNIKHYLSIFFVSLLVVFKSLQFAFFGVANIFSSLILNNNINQVQQFTKSEVEALKELAENVIVDPQKVEEIKVPNYLNEKEFHENERTSSFIRNFENKLSSIKNATFDFFVFDSQINSIEELQFNDFASLASPEMVPLELTTMQKSNTKKTKPKKNFNLTNSQFVYNNMPVIPFAAPRNNKTKMIQFSKTIDQEILDLMNVFLTLNLKPDNIDLNIVSDFAKNDLNANNDKKIIDQLSKRFHFLESLKDAIIYLPLKPPMEYYYVSSPYGMRIHPKTKKRQMHKGIDMAGTWQEEVRAASNGMVLSARRFGSFGNVIKIKHKHGVETVYGHLHKMIVKKGDFVQQGQIIGRMGATGRVKGAHLHYEIKVNSMQVNPYDFISLGRNLVSSSIIK